MVKHPALILASIAVAAAVGIASYTESVSPGAAFRYAKTSELPLPRLVMKDQERICPEDATDLTGCAK